ncbi:MAG: hypothetical protein KGN84_05840 [Acidobacteriota bacterium]|nr:hypothetical protein [Acidobacteriota bacterium]
MTQLSSKQQIGTVFHIIESAIERRDWETARRWVYVFDRARRRIGPEWREPQLKASIGHLLDALDRASEASIRQRLILCRSNLPQSRGRSLVQ